jgi:putative Flp pilus-assembly TadE/G-like protein
MRNRFLHLKQDERGMSFVFVGIGMTAFLAATTLAIDVGMFMNARTQAQNSADAGALSGVTALVFNDFNNRSSGGPAVQSAISAAKANQVIFQAPEVDPSDVTFPLGPTGVANRVKVDVFRTAARNNSAVPTLMGRLFGVNTVNIAATATAEASPANAMTCVKPFMIPDKWEEVQTPLWDTGDTFNAYDNHGNLLPDRDIYIPVRNCPVGCKDNPAYTGYSVQKDKGTRLVLRAGSGGNITPSFYYSWKMPGEIGADFYEENIANCNMSVVQWNDLIIQEPGSMMGPTIKGIERLIAKDPLARWDTGCKCVMDSAFSGQSPRVFPIPLYDPMYYDEGRTHGRDADFRVANFLGFFAEYISGNEIWGYITTVTGIVVPTPGTVPAGMFPVSIRLVQ